MHWAADLIGRPYRKGGESPETGFDCWGLVRHVFRIRHGIEMPVVAVADPSADNVAAIKRAAAVSGWRPIDATAPADADIVTMQGVDGPHVGVTVLADGALGLLHAVDGAGVCFQPLAAVQMAGFSGFQFWRRCG